MAFRILNFRLLFLIFLSLQDITTVSIRRNVYNTFEIEDRCGNAIFTRDYELYSEGMSSTMRLKAYREPGPKRAPFCKFDIRPPKGQEVVINFEHFDLGSMINNECVWEYLEISGEGFSKKKFCGNSIKGSSFYLGKEAHLRYYRTVFRQQGFSLVATACSKEPSNTSESFQCANGNYIWCGLKNDGVNNCGDNSDEITTEQGKKWSVMESEHLTPDVKQPSGVNSDNNNSMTKTKFTFMIVIIVAIVAPIIIREMKKPLCTKRNDDVVRRNDQPKTTAQRSPPRAVASLPVPESRRDLHGHTPVLDASSAPSGTTTGATQRHPQRLVENFVILETGSNLLGIAETVDNPPSYYTAVATEDTKNSFCLSPPRYFDIITSNLDGTMDVEEEGKNLQLPIADAEAPETEADVHSTPDTKISPSAP